MDFVISSVKCASIHRKIGTHITKVYAEPFLLPLSYTHDRQ